MQRLTTRVVFVLVASLAAFGASAACSSEGEGGGSDGASLPDAASEASTAVDAHVPDEQADAGPGDAAAADAALPPGHGVSVENVKTSESCDAVCSAKGYACGSTTCENLGGALGVVAYVGGTSTDVTSCTSVPPATSGGAKLVRVDCCCITPFLIVTGPKPAKSCDDVCTAAGLACDDQHVWPAGKGGLDAQYERPSTTAVTDHAMPCAKVPTATIALTKPTEKGNLTTYDCACVAP